MHARDDGHPRPQAQARQLLAQQRDAHGDRIDHRAAGSQSGRRRLKPAAASAEYPGRMDRGLYIAASGMLSELVRQDQISNDLANASTPGYKPDRATQKSFEDLLINNTKTGEQVGTPRARLPDRLDRHRLLAPAPLRQTDEALDFGIDGEGFFALQTPQGTRYTRNGQFSTNADGTLVSSLGYPVLSQGGGTIRVGAGGKVDADALGVFAVPNAIKQGESLFTGSSSGRAAGQARAGVLEGSGADPARSMVDMIASFRAFEAGQRVIRTLDETLQKASTQVGQT